MSAPDHVRIPAPIHSTADLELAVTQALERLARETQRYDRGAKGLHAEAAREGRDLARDCAADALKGALLRHLMDARPHARLIALYALRELARKDPRGYDGHYPVTERVCHALYDSASLVRQAAATLLGDRELCTHHTVRALERLLLDPGESDRDVQRAALRAAGESLFSRQREYAEDAIATHLDSRDEGVALEAAQALAARGHLAGAARLVRILHEHDEGPVLLTALDTVSSLNHKASRTAAGILALPTVRHVAENAGLRLLELIASGDCDVQGAAGRALSHLPLDVPVKGLGARHADAVMAALRPGHNPDEVRRAAAHLISGSAELRRALGHRAHRHLIEDLANPHDAFVREAAARALKAFGDEAALEPLRRAVGDYESLSWAAAHAALFPHPGAPGMAAVAAAAPFHERSH